MAGKSVSRSRKSSWVNSGKEALIDAAVAVVGGGVIGAALGKFSMVVGIPIAIYGVHKNNRWAKSMGIGIIAANGYQTLQSNPTAGLAGEVDNYGAEGVDGFSASSAIKGATARVNTYWKGFKNKLLITGSSRPANGLGSLDYQTNPWAGIGQVGEPDEPMQGVIGNLGDVNQANQRMVVAGFNGLGLAGGKVM